MTDNPSKINPIRWENDALVLLDQRYLPARQDDLVCTTLEQAAQAIKDLVVRGAPAIGITAAYAVYLGYLQGQRDACYNFEAACQYLIAARPTAVNLAWAVAQQQALIEHTEGDVAAALLLNARRIHQQDIDDNLTMGDFGAGLIEPGSRVLTHCNAGALATGGYGTALGVIRSAWRMDRIARVYASETRPWQQGLRLTAWELAEDEIPVTLIVEGAASTLFAAGKVDWVIVGADRICANGDVVNKIGTNNLSVMAAHYGVSMMVAAPLSTIDLETDTGAETVIEQRDSAEILGANYPANSRVDAWNPVFDVTPAGRVTAIVTERGVVLQPDKTKIQALFDSD